ncbi:tRNA pseudouridine(55) synthase TruB [Desulfogranum mediterraneum]|uniref:tRNA pseudouridine(55) synthase TruB n=1 Tax=Desulfogranum mediterraneum TaxID=160661 RepID=UPI0004043998|nr:tRNA pseudouridine(55) synthase TruB [Desulfogranum mediterraneum]
MKSLTVDAPGSDAAVFSAGVLLVDKPVGVTSFAMVARVRRLFGIKKVGHAGTLDPFASGLLVICVGRPATREIDRFMAGTKTYQATLQLGVETTTQDPEGEVTATREVAAFSRAEIDACLKTFVGPQLQAPPPFSAAKYKGKPLYHYARKGIMITKDPKPIEIYSLRCLAFQGERLEIEVSCSRGTYIRVLAADIGRKLGCGAHLRALRRTASGPFVVTEALSGDELVGEDAYPRAMAAVSSVEETLARLEQPPAVPGEGESSPPAAAAS